MLHALLALGIGMLPWRVALYFLVLIALASGIGIAVVAVSIMGWFFAFNTLWRYA